MRNEPRARILGIACQVPEGSILQDEAAAWATSFCPSHINDKLFAKLYARSGVDQRHCAFLEVGSEHSSFHEFYPRATSESERGPTTARRMACYDSLASKLAISSCLEVLQATLCPPSQVTHLVTVSCTGFSAPGVDIRLIQELELPATTQRTHIGFMGCHGAINGLRVAASIVKADPDAVVLLCAVELCSLHMQYGADTQQLVSNALFSDGSAAVIVVGDNHSAHKEAHCLQHFGSYILPGTEDLMRWQIGDHGFEMSLSSVLPGIIAQKLSGWLAAWLESQQLSIPEIQKWAIHPGGPRILSAVAAAANLEESQVKASREVLRKYGNMSSPTVLFILRELLREDSPSPIVALAFGPGVVAEAMLVSWDGSE